MNARCRAGVLVLASLAGCGSSAEIDEWDITESLLWRAADEDVQAELIAARVAVEAGDFDRAEAPLIELLDRHPENLTAQFLWQEWQLGRPGADPVVLAAVARAKAAQQAREVRDMLLAARLETDLEAARLLLEGALASNMPADLEAACRYALAYVLLQRGESAAAWSELERSLAKDPGSLRARRLEARLERGGDNLARSLAMLDYWVDQAELAPEISTDAWYGALLEVAEMNLTLDSGGATEDALDRFTEGRGEGLFAAPSPRRQALAALVGAALAADEGDPKLALEKVQVARNLVPPSTRTGRLAMIDQALLNELFLDRELDAIASWESVLARFNSATGVDADELIRALEARVRLARLRASQPK